MPPVRSSKTSSTERRHRLSAKIERLGILTIMAPCEQCQKSGSLCYVLKGCTRCSSCERKNVRCSGTFSDAEFESLEQRKRELRQQSQESRGQLSSLAQQLLVLHQSLLATQRRQDSIEKQLERITERQSAMVVQESRALEALEDHPEWLDNSEVALMSELDFSWDGLEGGPIVDHPISNVDGNALVRSPGKSFSVSPCWVDC